MSADWRQRFGAKLFSPERAVRLIRPGDHIYFSAGSAAPLGMYPALVSPDAPLGDNVIVHLLTLGDAPYTRPEHAGRFRHNALFIGSNTRDAVLKGRADYTPVFLSEVPGLIRGGRIRVDALIVAVPPPDDDGFINYGTHVDCAPAAYDVARVVIAAVNPRMPRVPGSVRMHVDRVAALVETDHPLPELPRPESLPEAKQIARHVADLIPDGATLQLGIGGIPDAVAGFLTDRKDLGIHTEMLGDGMMALARQGVVTGARKNVHPGKIIASFGLGSRALYAWMDRNESIELRPSEEVNDPVNIGRNDIMIALNTCLQVDLTGQVCADSIGESFYSGIGGQVDFIRGAARSRGGKPIIALPSTAQGGIISRIVPQLDESAGVVTTRGDVHYVVTEYGMVNLHGLTVRERALALASIAHPKFRPWLVAEAKRRRLLYSDQLEPQVRVPLYPKSVETRVQVEGGPVLIRPARPTDERLLKDLFYRLSETTIYLRFFSKLKYMPHETLQRFCTIDYETEFTLLATVRAGDDERCIGWASYHLLEDDYAEVAFLVEDAWQQRGIDLVLLRRLIEIAEARQVAGFSAVVLATNTHMLRVLERGGYPLETRQQDDVILVRIPFDTPRETWEAVDRRLRDRNPA